MARIKSVSVDERVAIEEPAQAQRRAVSAGAGRRSRRRPQTAKAARPASPARSRLISAGGWSSGRACRALEVAKNSSVRSPPSMTRRRQRGWTAGQGARLRIGERRPSVRLGRPAPRRNVSVQRSGAMPMMKRRRGLCGRRSTGCPRHGRNRRGWRQAVGGLQVLKAGAGHIVDQRLGCGGVDQGVDEHDVALGDDDKHVHGQGIACIGQVAADQQAGVSPDWAREQRAGWRRWSWA